jgi:hypothetical protein
MELVSVTMLIYVDLFVHPDSDSDADCDWYGYRADVLDCHTPADC